MANELAQLQVQLELQTAAFQAGVKQVDSRLKNMDRNVQKTSKSFKGMEAGLNKLKSGLVGIAASMAAAFSVQSVKNAIAFGDQMAKSAETVGLSVESFQQFSYAADRAGIAQSQFTSNMTAFVKRVGEAKAGVGPLVSGLKALDGELLEGIKSAKSQDEAFRLVMDAMNNAATATDRARIANAAFSRSGVAMGRMAEDYKELGDEAERLGLVMSDRTAKRAEVLQDKLTEMATSFKVTFTTAVIDATVAVSEFFGILNQVDSNAQKLADMQAELAQTMQNIYAFEAKTGDAATFMRVKAAKLVDAIWELHEVVKLDEPPAVIENAGKSAEKAIPTLKEMNEQIRNLNSAAKAVSFDHSELDSFVASLQSQAEAVKRAVDPIYVYEQGIQQLDTLLKNDLITIEHYNDAQKRLSETLIEATTPAIDEVGEAVVKMQSNSELMLSAFTDSFDAFANGVASGTTKIKDLFKNMVQSLIAQFLKLMAYKGIMSLLGGPGTALGSSFGQAAGILQPSALGNVFNHGRIQAFATGGIVGGPTTFSMSNGKTGLMGEAGPEAIMPLKRGPGGELGVNAVQPIVNVNNNAPVGVLTSSAADGTVDITIVERAVESAIRRGGNGIASAIESAYGVNRGAGAFGY